MTTPEGWARANLLLRTLQAPPPKGSLQEWALIFLLDRLEDIEHARFRALAQILVNKEEGAKAFEEYMAIAFPSIALRKKKRGEDMAKVLKAWTSSGPLRVIPLMPLQGRSKLKARTQYEHHERAGRLYRQLREKK